MGKINKENDFKDILRMLRKQKKLTQEQLASVLGYCYTAVSNYESGRNEPSIADLIKLSEFFKVPVDYLIGHDYYYSIETAMECERIRALKEINDSLRDILNKVDEVVKIGI